MANILSKKGLSKILIWVTAEIILNLIGLDDLADYSEFIFEHKLVIAQIIIAPTLPKIPNQQLPLSVLNYSI
ncbi:hypothetical protein STA3757_20610 [Stanieria sp. NIES-3757]|nr:hypothetical protein STA3757_20610 [Stanieria sp. NIES-3757]